MMSVASKLVLFIFDFWRQRHAARFGTQDPRLVMQARAGNVELPAPSASITTYWEEDAVPEGIPPGWWRLWNHERKNLALVVEKLMYEDGTQANQVWWRIFPTYLWPESTIRALTGCYNLIEHEDFARMGLQLIDSGPFQGENLEGWADSVEAAKGTVETLIDCIWGELPVIRPEDEP